MLTLTRRSGESIRIGDDIIVIVKEVHGGQVKVSVQAPRHISVLREELYQKLAQANIEAEKTIPDNLERWLKEKRP